MMGKYEFSIIASGVDHTADDFGDRFYDAGCDDALVSFQKGQVIIDFAREAESIEVAITSAVANVEAVGATIVRVEPDPLVNLSEIAARTDLSRQAIALYAKGQRGQDFPAPIAKVTAESPLWDWSTVARWLFTAHKVNKSVVIEAEVIKEANKVIANGTGNLLAQLRRKAHELEVAL